MIGRVIKHKYRILQEIGSGTVSTVYLAMNLTTTEVVALKVMHAELAEEGQFLARFRREAKLLEKLDSPYAVRLLDYGEEEGLNFIALEYVPGRTLDQVLKDEGPLEVERALGIAQQVAQCLADASAVGIVHRDLRPANVMLTSGEVVKVMDFGVAAGADLSRLSSTGIVGTPHYLAPELAEGETADARADVYSLGVILFEMLTGERPYDADDAASIVLKHRQEPIPSARQLNAEVSEEADRLITKCLAKQPQERYLPLQLVRAITDLLGEAEAAPGIEGALAGQTLGHYQLLERLGRGGMATVYKAYQPGLDRYVAVKVLPAYLAHEPGFAARFEQEARAIAKLDHPYILPVYDFGREGDLNYIVMKYVEAGTLKEMLGEPLPLARAMEIISQVGEALDYAHQEGVIHRDVKPGNVLMDRERWALLSDFGLAKMVEASVQLTKTGVGVGTPAYMSPEQAQSKGVNERSDVYSLGIVLFEMLTGRVPYEAETPMAVVIKHITAPVPRPCEWNPDIPEPVGRVVLKALAKAPADRYQGVKQMVEALQKAVAEAAVPAEAVPPPPSVVTVEKSVEIAPLLEPEVAPAPLVEPVAVPEEEVVPFLQKVPVWAWLGIAGVVLLIVMARAFPTDWMSKPVPTPTVLAVLTPTATPASLTPASTSTPLPTAIPTNTPLPGVITVPLENLAHAIPWLPVDKNAAPGIYFYGFNVTKKPFDNRLVRQAFAAATDRHAVSDLMNSLDAKGETRPATTFTPPETLGRDLYGQVGLPFNPAKAQALLAEAGYPNGQGFPAVTLVLKDTTGMGAQVAEAVAATWQENLGVDVKVENRLEPGYFDLLARDAPAIYWLGWLAAFNDPDHALNLTFHSRSEKNYSHFSNAEFDRLVEQAAILSDPTMRQALYIQAERILCEDQAALIPLFHFTGQIP